VLKLAMSLDGETTTPIDDSPWITGRESRELVHRWRAEHDAIAVGIGTALADDPLLTARVPGAHQPRRVVFDSAARLPLNSQLVRTQDQSPLTLLAGPAAPPESIAALREDGVEVFVAKSTDAAERIGEGLAALGRRGITSLFLEGGRTLAGSFAAAGQIDESRTFVAPMLLGPPSANVFADPAVMPAPRLEARATTTSQVGADTLLTARFREW
jgi:diaminohydroxyphosphoribosylaminopyrimidine deaminase/5-amino-6-(5-phosphoribosylamino)uracil reductase